MLICCPLGSSMLSTMLLRPGVPLAPRPSHAVPYTGGNGQDVNLLGFLSLPSGSQEMVTMGAPGAHPGD